jgi:hypothetical protein
VDENWAEVNLVEGQSSGATEAGGAGETPARLREGIVSPVFRRTVFAPYLKLTAKGGKKPCVFRTIFLASEPV